MYLLSVLCMFKNESTIIKEWFEHYISEGIDHFYLIDNDKQLDLSIGRGLNNDMFYVSAGFSIDIY